MSKRFSFYEHSLYTAQNKYETMLEAFSLFWCPLFIKDLRVLTANLIGKRLHIRECQPPYETFACRLKHFKTLLHELYAILFDTTIFPNIVSTIHQIEFKPLNLI